MGPLTDEVFENAAWDRVMGYPMFCFISIRIFFTESCGSAFLTFRSIGFWPAVAEEKRIYFDAKRRLVETSTVIMLPWHYTGRAGDSPGTGKQATCQPYGERRAQLLHWLLIEECHCILHVSTGYLLMGNEPRQRESQNDLLSIISELSMIAKKI